MKAMMNAGGSRPPCQRLGLLSGWPAPGTLLLILVAAGCSSPKSGQSPSTDDPMSRDASQNPSGRDAAGQSRDTRQAPVSMDSSSAPVKDAGAPAEPVVMGRPNTFKREVAPLPAGPGGMDAGADAPSPSCAKCPIAVLVTPSADLDTGDQVLATRLELAGYRVVVQPHPDKTTEAVIPKGATVVVISESVSSSSAHKKFFSAPVGVVVLEASIQDDMMLTGAAKTDYGVAKTTNSLDIVAPGPLTGGLKGTVAVSPGIVGLVWGIPGPEALKIAALSSDPTKFGIYAYEAGATLVGGARTPARRVVNFMSSAASEALILDGAKLFEASVNWAARSKVVAVPPPPMPDAGVVPPPPAPAPATDAGVAK